MCAISERGADEPDRQPRQPAGELHDDEEDRQQVDEPQRAERLDEGFEISGANAAPAHVGGKHRRLEGELDRHPQHVEIGEVHDLAVEIVAPVAVDDAGQEQAGDQEEVGHAERPREGDRGMHPALAAGRLLDAERRMHHHHHDDAEALGVVDPIDPAGLRHLHHRFLPRGAPRSVETLDRGLAPQDGRALNSVASLSSRQGFGRVYDFDETEARSLVSMASLC